MMLDLDKSITIRGGSVVAGVGAVVQREQPSYKRRNRQDDMRVEADGPVARPDTAVAWTFRSASTILGPDPDSFCSRVRLPAGECRYRGNADTCMHRRCKVGISPA